MQTIKSWSDYVNAVYHMRELQKAVKDAHNSFLLSELKAAEKEIDFVTVKKIFELAKKKQIPLLKETK